MKKDKFPDKRSMEKSFADIQKIMNSKQFDTIEDAQAFMNTLTGKQIPEFDGIKTPAEQAQDMIYEAYDKKSSKDKILLAYKALHIYPDCADAYNLLAEEEAKSDAEKLELYKKSEEAGRRALGEAFINENKGKLWMFYEARPYMRAMEGVANGLMYAGKKDEAINKYREMLELNKNDNQGARYMLCSFLCVAQRFAEAEELMNSEKYNDDNGIEWFYNRALAEFGMRGDTPKARQLAMDAIKRNLFVLAFMSGASKIPKHAPESYSINSEEEAVIYMHESAGAWMDTPGALAWFMGAADEALKKHGPELTAEFASKQTPVKAGYKPGRNDPCPCGSGKKYKKCCGSASAGKKNETSF
jgi:tetratricopeptide (TPR) repeat protein